MDFFEMIASRRSIRRFDGTKVSENDINRILNGAFSAPSSKNCQSSSFIVVQDGDVLQKISGMRDFGSSFLKYSPAAIVVLGDETLSDLWVDNAAISATYVQLAAQALGLGSCWVHVNGRPRLKDDPGAGTAEDYLRTFLPIADTLHPLCVIALGHPEKQDRTQRETADNSHRVVRM